MNDAVLKINSVTIYGFSVVLAVSFLWGAFVMHKKAIEAHFDDFMVLDMVVLGGFWSFVFGRLSFVLLNPGVFWNNWSRVLFLKNYPGLDHWGLLVGLVLVTRLVTKKSEHKFFDWMDLISLGVIGSMSIFFAGMTLLTFSWQIMVLSVVSLLVFIYLWKAEREYRKYDWYKKRKTEARSGFLTGTSLAYYGLVAVAVGLITVPRTFWVIAGNAILFVAGIVLVYIRSGRQLQEDLKFIFKNAKKTR